MKKQEITATNLLNPTTYSLMLELMGKEKKTAYENTRLDECKRLIANELVRVRKGEPKNCGLNGCLFELLTSTEKSTKVKVARQGKTDNRFYLDGKRMTAEDKTNGGRIGSLFRKDGTPRTGYIVVGYCVLSRSYKTDKITGAKVPNRKWYVAPTTLWKIEDFVNMLNKYQLTKYIGHSDRNDTELAIKGDNMKLYKILLEYPITYEPEARYTSDDFEGLEF